MNEPKLRFPEFNGEWEEKNLGEIVTLMQSGLSRKLEGKDIGLPVLRSNNLIGDKLNLSDIRYWYVVDDKGANLENYFLKKGDLLVNFINSINQIGKTALYNGELNRNAIFTTNIMRLNFNSNTDVFFIHYYFQTKKYLDYIQSITKPAVNQASFTTIDFKRFKLNLPSFSEQKKIAFFLSKLDEKIGFIEKKREYWKTYKKGTMQKIFSQKLRFKGENGENYPDWEIKEAKEIFINYSNKIHDGNLPILAVTQDKGVVYRNSIDIQIKSSNKSITSYKLIEPGNFVISLRSFQGGIEYSKIKGISSPAYTVLKPKIEIVDYFYKYYFKKEEFISKLNSAVIGIREGKQISYGVFSEMLLPYPSIPEQSKIANYFSIIDLKINLIDEELGVYKDFKKGLLQQMFC